MVQNSKEPLAAIEADSDPVTSDLSRFSQQAFRADTPSYEDDGPQPNPLKYVVQLLRGRIHWVVLASCAFAFTGATAGYFAKGPVYTSAAIIQVSASRPGILYNDQDDSRLRLFDAFVASEASYLGSRPVMERALTQPAIEQLGWEPSAESFRKLRDAIDINSKDGLITVACNHSQPETAASLVNSLLDAYQEMHVEYSRREDSVRDRQLTRREAELLEKLERIEQQIREVGQEYSLQSIASAHVRKIAQIQELDQRVDELETTVASREAQDALSEVDTGDVEIKRLVVLDHALADMLFERAKRAAGLSSLPSDLGSSHPAVRQATLAIASIDAAIEDRRAQLATLGTTGALTKAGKSADSESLLGLKALLSRLQSRVEELRVEAKELNGRLIQLEFLDQERDQVRQLLEETRQGLEQVRVESQNTLPGTSEIRARGSIPTEPSSDKRKILAAAGAAGGCGAGAVLVLGFAFIFRRIRFSDELTTGFPQIPLAGVLPATESSDTDAEYSAAIHRLRNQLQLACSGDFGNQLIVATGVSENSKTAETAIALARSFSESHLRTAIVDADLVAQQVSTRLRLGGNHGVKEAILNSRLNGEVKAIQEDHLFAVPSGLSDQITDKRISKSALQRLFRELRQQFDVIVIDVGTFDDRLVAELAVALADQILLLVPTESSNSAMSRVAGKLNQCSGRIHSVLESAYPNDPSFIRTH